MMIKRFYLSIIPLLAVLLFFSSCPDYIGEVADEFRNNAPVANAGHDQYVIVGAIVSLDGSKTTDPENDALDYEWKFVSIPLGGSGAGISGLGDGDITGRFLRRAIFVPDVAGTFEVALRVEDAEGKQSEDVTVVQVVAAPTANALPVAAAGEDQSAKEGDTLDFSGSGSTDADGFGDIVSFTWDFGDGSPEGAGENISHTYTAAGEYTVSLTVEDSQGASDTDTLTATITAAVEDGPPQAAIAYTLTTPPRTYFFDGSGSYDPDGAALKYEWEISNGAASFPIDGNPESFSITLVADQIYTVSLTVTDQDNGVSDSAAVKISTVSDITQAEFKPVADLSYLEAEHKPINKEVNLLGWAKNSRGEVSRAVTLMKFDLAALEDKKIVKAILAYQVTGYESGDGEKVVPPVPKQKIVSLPVERDWSEESLPEKALFDPDDPHGVADGITMQELGRYELNLTELVALWVSGKLPNAGLALVTTRETKPILFLTGSRENEKAAPVLTVEYDG